MKKIVCLMLCLVFCFGALVGCGGLEENEKGPEVRMYIADFPYTLDPAVAQLNSDVDKILTLIYEPLTKLDEDGEVQPALATEWWYEYDEVYGQHKMYFQMKETQWSDKRAVSADDVIFAWRRILSPEMDSPYASLLFGIKGARELKSGTGTIDDLGLAAADDTLLEVTFEKEYNCDLFAEQVSNIHLAPCREDVISRTEGTDWSASVATLVCNGPFRVQMMDMPREQIKATTEDGTAVDDSDWDKNFTGKLVLERNSYYMREEDDDVDEYVTPYRINIYYYEGQTDYYPNEIGLTQRDFQSNRYESGELYLLGAFDRNEYSSYSEDMETTHSLNGYAYYFNTTNDILSDADVRKAFSAALDRNAIVGVTGTGEVAATGYVPEGVFNTDNESDFREAGGAIYSTSADMNTASSLVAGKSKGSLDLVFLLPQNSYTIKYYSGKINYTNTYEAVANQAKAAWEALGYTINLKPLYPEDYLEALQNRDFDIIGVNIVSGAADAFGYLAPFAKEYSGTSAAALYEGRDTDTIPADEEIFNTHYTGIDSADYSALITNALFSVDRAQRADYLHQAEAMLAELCPATMVYWYTNSYVASDEISGVDTDSWFGYFDFTDLSLDDWREVNSKEAEIELQRALN